MNYICKSNLVFDPGETSAGAWRVGFPGVVCAVFLRLG
jgi:hypothetical protein